MKRFFNTAGPVNPGKHYCLPPLERFDLEQILSLIDQEKYFVLHAPRQTGKTSAMLALMEYLNQRGQFRCLYVNVEPAQTAREDVARGMRTMLGEIASSADLYLNDSYPAGIWLEVLAQHGEHGALGELLARWSRQLSRPLVLIIDEIDSLVGDTLVSVLRQLRAGYTKRPAAFPQSVILCGVRDIRDYRIHASKEKEIITGGSAFNIKAESLRLGNFTRKDVEVLLTQHTTETGQVFLPEAVAKIWDLTQGQPWLVNALAYETTFKISAGRDRAQAITSEMVTEAKENLILRRETHLDQLADKLGEERVQRVIGPILAGQEFSEQIPRDDIEYVIDLGLVSRLPAGYVISNPIYREVLPRELTVITAINLTATVEPVWYILPDGRLDMNKLMAGFQEFFRENAESWLERFAYKEAGPQLLMQAFLQRIINSGGRIEREYGLGRKRTDLLVLWKHPAGVQKVVVELKLLWKGLERTLADGLAQTCEHMDRCGAAEGHLVIFDRATDRPWEEKCFTRKETCQGRTITVWGM